MDGRSSLYGRFELNEHDYYITSQLWAQNSPLTPLLQTAFLPQSGQSQDDVEAVHWHDILTFPIKYRDLTPDAHICFTVWAPSSISTGIKHGDVVVGGTTLPFFGKLKYILILMLYIEDSIDWA